jgi:hypothetical protein
MGRGMLKPGGLEKAWKFGERMYDHNLKPAKLLLLPGIMNVRFHLMPLKRMIERAYPVFDVDLQKWGTPLGWVSNLQAHDRNLQTAKTIAGQLTAYRQLHPSAVIDVIGNSAGGGLAGLIVEALPEDIAINRLIMIAPALAFDYPVVQRLLPKVKEFIVNYASPYDLQISVGTKIFGNMDRTFVRGAGSCGFNQENHRLVQIKWHSAMIGHLHFGNHTSYLSPFWQKRYLLPAIDPTTDIKTLLHRII